MKHIDIREAEDRFSEMMHRVQRGEEIVIVRSSVPIARLCPVEPGKLRLRRPGTAKGLIKIHDDFDAPLPLDVGKALGES